MDNQRTDQQFENGKLGANSQRYLTRQRKHYALIVLCALALLASLIIDILTGPGHYSLPQIVEALSSPAFNSSSNQSVVELIVWQVRIPTALLAALVGAALAIAGAQMQTILNNVLADPFTLGVSSAASFGAALAIVLGFSLVPHAGSFLIALNAFILALIASLALWFMSLSRSVNVSTMVLIGIAIMFFFSSLLGIIQALASSQSLQQLLFWSLGSMARASWNKIACLMLIIALVMPYFYAKRWQLTALRFGDIRAQGLGVNVKKLRLGVLLCCALLTATSVAFVGTIGFIGLVAPHIARLMVGEDQRVFLPLSALLGGLILSLTSIVAKSVVPGIVLPIGLITALVGLPFFVSLIFRSTRRIS